jgi:hypothetical protein
MCYHNFYYFRLELQRRLVRPHSFPVRPRLLQRHQVHRFLDRPYHDRGLQAHLEQVLEEEEHDQREGLRKRRYARYDRERERDEVSLESQHVMVTCLKYKVLSASGSGITATI